jgi:hypothetical protein
MPIILQNSNLSFQNSEGIIYNSLIFNNSNVGIGVNLNDTLNNTLEVNGSINIPTNSKFKINNNNFGYSNLDHKLLAGTNISIDAGFRVNNTYSLPFAGIGSGGTLGGVRVDNSTIIINGSGVISGANTYTLPTAGIGSGGSLGGVRVDNSTITINGSGVISSVASSSRWTTSGVNIYNNNTGNVGIGTNTTPETKLDVNGNLLIRAYAGTSGTNGIFFRPGFATTNQYNCSILTFDHSSTGANDGISINGFQGVSFCTGGNTRNERMRIPMDGNVGIGLTNPSFKVHIKSVYDNMSSGLTFDASDHATYQYTIWPYVVGADAVGWRFRVKSIVGGDNTAIQIDNNGAVYFPNGSSSASDSRIKKDIEDINDETALNKLLLIQPTTYNYIDQDRNKGYGKVYGFIAQQIKDVIPEAITIVKKEIIPNICKSCLVKNKREIYHNIPTDIPIDTDVKIDNVLYKIKKIYKEYFEIDQDINTDTAFVYGYSVDDFHSLNKDYIFTLNVCATQELYRRIELRNQIIKSNDDRIKDLESKVALLLVNNSI